MASWTKDPERTDLGVCFEIRAELAEDQEAQAAKLIEAVNSAADAYVGDASEAIELLVTVAGSRRNEVLRIFGPAVEVVSVKDSLGTSWMRVTRAVDLP